MRTKVGKNWTNYTKSRKKKSKCNLTKEDEANNKVTNKTRRKMRTLAVRTKTYIFRRKVNSEPI